MGFKRYGFVVLRRDSDGNYFAVTDTMGNIAVYDWHILANQLTGQSNLFIRVFEVERVHRFTNMLYSRPTTKTMDCIVFKRDPTTDHWRSLKDRLGQIVTPDWRTLVEGQPITLIKAYKVVRELEAAKEGYCHMYGSLQMVTNG
jgi:hypothetical protein